MTWVGQTPWGTRGVHEECPTWCGMNIDVDPVKTMFDLGGFSCESRTLWPNPNNVLFKDLIRFCCTSSWIGLPSWRLWYAACVSLSIIKFCNLVFPFRIVPVSWIFHSAVGIITIIIGQFFLLRKNTGIRSDGQVFIAVYIYPGAIYLSQLRLVREN